jgi:hypothetical protein
MLTKIEWAPEETYLPNASTVARCPILRMRATTVILTMPGVSFLASIVTTARCPETEFELGTKSQASRRTGLVNMFDSAFRIKKGLHPFTDWSKA